MDKCFCSRDGIEITNIQIKQKQGIGLKGLWLERVVYLIKSNKRWEMVTVTGRAKEELKRILSAKADNPQATVRLSTGSSGEFVLGIDVEKTSDKVIEHKGSKVLSVEHELATSLEGYTLAFEDKKFVMAKGPLSGFNKSAVTFNEQE